MVKENEAPPPFIRLLLLFAARRSDSRRSCDTALAGSIPVTAASSSSSSSFIVTAVVPPPPSLPLHHTLTMSLSLSLCPPLRCVSSWLLPDSPGWKTTAVSRPPDSSSSSRPPSHLLPLHLLLLLLLLQQLLLHSLPSPCLALAPCPDCCSFAPTSSPTSYCLETRDRKQVNTEAELLRLSALVFTVPPVVSRYFTDRQTATRNKQMQDSNVFNDGGN